MSNFHTYLRPGENADALEDIMTAEGVTLPVARNIFKMRSLGLMAKSSSANLDPRFLPSDRSKGSSNSDPRDRDRRNDGRERWDGRERRERDDDRDRRSDRERDRDGRDRERDRDGRDEPRGSGSLRPAAKHPGDSHREKMREMQSASAHLHAAFEHTADDVVRKRVPARQQVEIGRLGPVAPRVVNQDDDVERKDRTRKQAAAALLGFEAPDDEEIERARKRKNLGIARLGAVEARGEQVDPLQRDIARDIAARQPDPESEDDEEYQQPVQATSSVSAEEMNSRQRTRKQRLQDALQGQGANKGRNEKSQANDDRGSNNKRARDESSESAEPEPTKGGVMSEAQIVKLMSKQKKAAGSSKASGRSKLRVQQEWLEWEKKKQGNQEYWKPPKHCLVTKDVHLKDKDKGAGRGR